MKMSRKSLQMQKKKNVLDLTKKQESENVILFGTRLVRIEIHGDHYQLVPFTKE